MSPKHFANQGSHEEFAKKVVEQTGFCLEGGEDTKGKEVFLQHYFGKYSEPKLPPSWMIIEVLPITALSKKAFESLQLREDRKRISSEFDLNPEVLQSWVHAISYVKNLCAHHSRLWNRELTIRPLISKVPKFPVENNSRFFAQACVISFLLKKVSPQSKWWERFCKLVSDNPFIDPNALGAPAGWKPHSETPMWVA